MCNRIVIEVSNVSKRFADKSALENITFSVGEGELFVFVGPDGAGKTTLLRILSSIYLPSSGRIDFRFRNKSSSTAQEYKRQGVGYMPQRFSLYHDLSVMENLNFFADMFLIGKEERKKRIVRLLDFSKLGEFSGRPAGKLSGGMQKKLSLSCVLLHEPEILLLDEPTNGVDPISRGELWSILYSLLRRGKTIILTTPYMEEAEKATHIGFLVNGRLVMTGTPEELKSSLSNGVFVYTGKFMTEIRDMVNVTFGFSYFVGSSLRIILKDQKNQNLMMKSLRTVDNNFRLKKEEVVFEDLYLAYTKGILNVDN